MKRFITHIVFGLGALALIAIPLTNAALAVESTDEGSGQALEINPPVINLTANPGETVTTQIKLRDISNGPLLVTGEMNDFVAAGEDGIPDIIMDENEDPSPYSLKNWVEPLSQFTLQPKQIEDLNITINVPADAAPGGYYGVARFTGAAPDIDGTGVSLSASIGSLIFLKVNGEVAESMAVEEFFVSKDGKTSSLFESTPLQFVERIKNTGNIHEQPAGQVTITDMFGKKVAAVNVNLPPRNVLPQSIRKFEQPLDKSVIGNKVLFGRYRADLNITYGADKQKVTSSTVFWVIPYRIIGLAILVLIIGFVALRHMIRRYNRHIIKSAQKPRRK